MYNQNIIIISETVNRLIVLMQSQRNEFTNAPDALSKVIAGAKIEAFSEAINILQSQGEQIYGGFIKHNE